MIDSLGGLSGPNSQILGSVYIYDQQKGSYNKILSDDAVQIIAIE